MPTEPVSTAVPLTVTGVPLGSEALAAGEVMETVGAVVSVEAAAATEPLCSVAGCTPRSAS